jgi:integrase
MIKVTLINPANRKFYLAQWDDPVTGKTKTESTKCTVKREAERYAARLEDQLNNGQHRPRALTTWAELQERYEREVGAGKALKTRLKTRSMFNAIAELMQPRLAESMADPNAVSQFGAALREPRTITSKHGKTRIKQAKPFTVKGHLAELRKVLRWAARMGIVREMPHIEMPQCTEGMKGRPITGEELDRMREAIAKATQLPAEYRSEWDWMLRGLWLSGLRLEEAMRFHWTDDRHLSPDFTGRRPMLRIQAMSEKGRTYRMLPITPDFAAMLAETPSKDRRGFVFNPWTHPQGRVIAGSVPHRPTANHVGRIISQFGELAGVKVNDGKFASAHDLRRAFGYRWSKLVMPKVLQELMRHESIQTTMRYYVGQLAEDAADAVWAASARETGNTSGNTQPDATAEKSKNIKKLS